MDIKTIEDNLYTFKAKITKIVDGDTIHADIFLGFFIVRSEILRLARINAPEIRGEERPDGLKAKAWLESKISIGDDILVRTYKWQGKYGRFIAEIIIPDENGQAINLNDEMVKEGQAVYIDY